MESSHRICSLIGNRTCVDLSDQEFREIKASRSFLLEYMHFEECYMQMIVCLSEFEKFLLNSAQSYFLFSNSRYDYLEDQRVIANTKVTAFLNSLTSFRDQAPRIHKHIESGWFKRRFWELWSREQSSSVTFKFCDYFRNYSQHETQPVNGVTVGGGWDNERNLCEHHTSVYVKTQKVLENKSVPQVDYEEINAAMGEKADISLVLREAAGSVGNIVRQCRKELINDFTSSSEIYDKWLLEFSKCEKEVIAIVQTRIDGDFVENFDLFQDFLARARRLRKNNSITNNQKHFISNRPRGHNS